MPMVIGVVLALVVCTYVAVMRMDRDRALYPTMLVVIASYYVLFAVMDGGGRVIGVEVLLAVVFVVAASVGFRRSAWITASALAAHGLLDAVHGGLVSNPGVPAWWPAFCLAFDVTAGAYLAWALTRQMGSRSVERQRYRGAGGGGEWLRRYVGQPRGGGLLDPLGARRRGPLCRVFSCEFSQDIAVCREAAIRNQVSLRGLLVITHSVTGDILFAPAGIHAACRIRSQPKRR